MDDVIEFGSVVQAYCYAKTYYSAADVSILSPLRGRIMSTIDPDELNVLAGMVPEMDEGLWEAERKSVLKNIILEAFSQEDGMEKELLDRTRDAIVSYGDYGREWDGLVSEAVMGARDFILRERPRSKSSYLYLTHYESKGVPSDALCVQLTGYCPEGMKSRMDYVFKTAAPDYRTMVEPLRKGLIGWEEASRLYIDNVLVPNREKILEGVRTIMEDANKEGVDVCVFGDGRTGLFSFGYVFSNFLNENGVACMELPWDRKSYGKGVVSLYGEEGYIPVGSMQPVSGETVGEVRVDVPGGIVFTESSGGYSQRTRENAEAEDVDFTFAFAVDFKTAGELATARYAGESLVRIPLKLKEGGGLDMSPESVERSVDVVKKTLPDEFFNGESCGLNIAGNGLYTLSRYSVSQEDIDQFVISVGKRLVDSGMRIASVRSGGQTGADEAGIAMAAALGIPAMVHAPKGWEYRGANGVDVWVGRDAFIERFRKDYHVLETSVEKEEKGWARYAKDGYEVSSAGDSRFSAFKARFPDGASFAGHDVSGKSVEEVYQTLVKGYSDIKEGKGLSPCKWSPVSVLYRGYALDEDRKASDIRETVAGTAADYVEGFDARYHFTTSRWEAEGYAEIHSDASEEEFMRDGKVVRQRNRHYSGKYPQVSSYALKPGTSFMVFEDIRDYDRNSALADGVDVVVLKKGTLTSDASEFIVRNGAEDCIVPMKDVLSPDELSELSYGWYKQIWRQWADLNPDLMQDLSRYSAGKVLTDKFASSVVSQARALSEILAEGRGVEKVSKKKEQKLKL